MTDLTNLSTLANLRDQQIQQAYNALSAALVIQAKMCGIDEEDERILTKEQERLLNRALKCCDCVMNDEF